jgi:hypothetical protein
MNVNEPPYIGQTMLSLQTPLESIDAAGLTTLLGQVEALKFRILKRLDPVTPPPPAAEPGRLVGIAEAAKRLGMSKGWLYRNAGTMSFAVRPNGHNWRFDTKKIDEYLRARAGG